MFTYSFEALSLLNLDLKKIKLMIFKILSNNTYEYDSYNPMIIHISTAKEPTLGAKRKEGGSRIDLQ